MSTALKSTNAFLGEASQQNANIRVCRGPVVLRSVVVYPSLTGWKLVVEGTKIPKLNITFV